MAPKLNGRSGRPDGVVRRNLKPRPIDFVKSGPRRKQAKRDKGVTVTCSFTLTEEIDAMIEKMASDQNCSRSRVVRQALIIYALENSCG